MSAIQEGNDPALRGPLASSVRIGFIMLYAAVAVLGVGWATRNVRQVPPDSRAVVLRFGQVDRVRGAGLLLAWPQPIEQVRFLPSADRQIGERMLPQEAGFQSDETDVQLAPNDDVIHLQGERDVNNAAYLLTGDGNAVRLDTTVFFTIRDPAAYLLAEDHVLQALRRIYLASAVALSTRRNLDDFLVARPDSDGETGTDPGLASRRQTLRGDLVADMNIRLARLREGGQDLGIDVARVDLVALLPPVAKTAFDAVLTATQIADQNAAAARTDAARISQEAQREHDRLLTEASAAAEEVLRTATSDAAPVDALERQEGQTDRSVLMAQAYQQQIARIMQQAGDVTAVDLRGNQILVPGPGPGANP